MWNLLPCYYALSNCLIDVSTILEFQPPQVGAKWNSVLQKLPSFRYFVIVVASWLSCYRYKSRIIWRLSIQIISKFWLKKTVKWIRFIKVDQSSVYFIYKGPSSKYYILKGHLISVYLLQLLTSVVIVPEYPWTASTEGAWMFHNKYLFIRTDNRPDLTQGT